MAATLGLAWALVSYHDVSHKTTALTGTFAAYRVASNRRRAADVKRSREDLCLTLRRVLLPLAQKKQSAKEKAAVEKFLALTKPSRCAAQAKKPKTK